MPSINLRLTDEEHAELIAAAKRESRSLQREIVYRLFNNSEGAVRGRAEGAGGRSRDAGSTQSSTGLSRPSPSEPVVADSQSRDVHSRTIQVNEPADHFRPDPKPERKKK